MRRLWRLFLAYFRLDLGAVCEMSRGRGMSDDFHDYPDSWTPEPWHMYTHHCRRCQKAFLI